MDGTAFTLDQAGKVRVASPQDKKKTPTTESRAQTRAAIDQAAEKRPQSRYIENQLTQYFFKRLESLDYIKYDMKKGVKYNFKIIWSVLLFFL